MKIVVIGGTGLVGSKVVSNLRQKGHEVIAAAPNTGVNTITGEGLTEALAGAQIVIDVANSPSFADEAVLDFFKTAGRNLAAAEKVAGVRHHIALSVVGTDRLPESGYLRAKLAQEELIKASGIPYTIIRSTQFFEFLGGIAQSATDGQSVHLSPAHLQPVASDDVAALVAKVATMAPANGVIELAGPERIGLDDLVRRYLAAKHDTRKVVTDIHARYFGTELNDTIYEGLDFHVRRKERWCVMGINGAGKSTLLKLVTGSTHPDAGTVKVGGSVKMGYFAQHAMDLLVGERTVFQTLEDAFPQAGHGSLRSLAGCFGFSGDDVEKRCRVLSGGEKARLVMAKMLYDPPNFLVLDEPTNHLDMATKQMLITALSDYEGAMLFVSHDRHFLAALSNRVLELTPDGIHNYGGGYSEYVARTGHEAPGLRS